MEQARLDIFPYFPIFNHQKCYISFLVTQEPKNSNFQIFLINPSQNTKNRVVQKISPKLMLLKILIFSRGCGGENQYLQASFQDG